MLCKLDLNITLIQNSIAMNKDDLVYSLRNYIKTNKRIIWLNQFLFDNNDNNTLEQEKKFR